MAEILEEYEDFLVETKHASGNTVASYMRDLHQFVAYLQGCASRCWTWISPA